MYKRQRHRCPLGIVVDGVAQILHVVDELVPPGSILSDGLSAILGTIIMGIGSFSTCLATSENAITLGNGMLVVSIIMMVFGYSKWQP